MASEWKINRLPGLLAIKMIRDRSALPTDSHTSLPPPPISGGSDELKQNTADLRVDHHLCGDWAFIRTSLFLAQN